jgi:hypothetical protein
LTVVSVASIGRSSVVALVHVDGGIFKINFLVVFPTARIVVFGLVVVVAFAAAAVAVRRQRRRRDGYDVDSVAVVVVDDAVRR